MYRRIPLLLGMALIVGSLNMAQAAPAERPAQAVNAGGMQNVSRDPQNSLRPRVAQDPDGNIHVVWDSEERARVVRYAKGIWNGSAYIFGETFVVGDAGEFQYATPSVAIAPNGTIMVTWSQNDGVYVRTWDARSGGPAGPAIRLGAGLQSTVAADSRGGFHIAWNGDFKIQYCHFVGGSCQNRDAFSENASNRPDIIVDSNDGIHLVWDGGGVYYRARSINGGWGSIERLDAGIAAQIAADGQGNVHLVWSRDFDIQYCRRTLGSPCTDRHTIHVGDDLDPSIGATPQGTVIVAFRDARGRQLYYVVRENGAWSGARAVGSGPTAPDMSPRAFVERASFVWSLDFDIQLVTAVGEVPPLPVTPPAPPVTPPNGRLFPETGQVVSGRLLQYWDQNGGLPVFGLPLNAQAQRWTLDGTYEMQLFERNRLELHPANAAPYDVLLGRLGGDLLYKQGRPWETLPREQPRRGCLYFAETQHNICEPFLGYWRSHGLEFGDRGVSFRESLALFGLPLTTPAVETNPDGDTVLTQWFERARFEYHPQNPDPYKILLGRLGAEAGP